MPTFKDVALAVNAATYHANVDITGSQLVALTTSLEDSLSTPAAPPEVPAWAVELLHQAVAADQSVLCHLDNGRKIQAIKDVRAKYVGVSLKMSKDAVESGTVLAALSEYQYQNSPAQWERDYDPEPPF